jgi:hypothetical protein
VLKNRDRSSSVVTDYIPDSWGTCVRFVAGQATRPSLSPYSHICNGFAGLFHRSSGDWRMKLTSQEFVEMCLHPVHDVVLSLAMDELYLRFTCSREYSYVCFCASVVAVYVISVKKVNLSLCLTN